MSQRKRALLVCPGRGSYRANTLGVLKNRAPRARQIIQACDDFRAQQNQTTVTDLDASETFKGSLHVAGENASLLTFACSMADATDIDTERFEIAGVMGNSMGFYTALAASEALSTTDAIQLIETMAQYQRKNIIGGQVMYPLTDENWLPSSIHIDAISQCIAQGTAEGHRIYWSINLGSHAVLGADKGGLKYLMKNLPHLEIGSRSFPIQLPLHSAFHTPLMDETAQKAQSDLRNMSFNAPKVPLIDGLGRILRPYWTDSRKIWDYTLGAQVNHAYDFSLSFRTALSFVGPDVVIVLGPGNALGGPLARIMVQENWQGLSDRNQFEKRQNENPVLLSFGVNKQRDIVTRTKTRE